jgi:hypothetical protein
MMLAAQGYQESTLDQKKRSSVGASPRSAATSVGRLASASMDFPFATEACSAIRAEAKAGVGASTSPTTPPRTPPRRSMAGPRRT